MNMSESEMEIEILQLRREIDRHERMIDTMQEVARDQQHTIEKLGNAVILLYDEWNKEHMK